MLTSLAQKSLVSRVPEALFGPLGVEFMPSDQVIEKTAKKNRTPINISAEKIWGKNRTPINISAEKIWVSYFPLIQTDGA